MEHRRNRIRRGMIGERTAKEILLDYYTEDSKLFAMLWTHSRQVAELALQIALNYKDSAVDAEFVNDAALLHDIGIFRTNAPDIYCVGDEPYIRHGVIGSELLKARGLDRYALVCERHTGAGLSCREIEERQLPLPHRDMLPLSVEEKIICYADKFYSKSNLTKRKPVDKIRKGMQKFGDEQLRRFDEMHAMFGSLLPF